MRKFIKNYIDQNKKMLKNFRKQYKLNSSIGEFFKEILNKEDEIGWEEVLSIFPKKKVD